MNSFLSFQNRSIHLQIIYCLYDKINEEYIIEFNNFFQKSFPKCITIRFWSNHPVERKREKNFCSRSQSFHQTWWLEPKIIQLRIIGE